jgi:uncharacterized protein DUF3455
MSSRVGSVALASVATLLAGEMGCAAADRGRPEASPSASACSGATPTALAAPAGNELAFELLADGVQIYSCGSSGGAAASPTWTFQAPEATLADSRGQVAGTHGAGPTWKALDGSSVVGAKVEAATPDPSAIPWLLLRAASHAGGPGRMADVTFVQRLRTSGGNAPTEGCSSATLGAVARVPYRAVYCFYRGKESRPYAENSSPAPSRGAPATW